MSIFLLNSYVYEVVDVPVEQIANAEAMSFNGTDQYIDSGSSSNFQFQASDSFTLSAWIYPTVSQANRQTIIGNRNWNTSPYQGWSFKTSLQSGVNRIEMVIDSGTTMASYYTTTWCHWFKALSADKIRQIYNATAVVNGVTQTANLFTGGLDTSLVYWNRMGDS